MAVKNTTIRLDETLLHKLRLIAKKECRSVNKQIMIAVRSYVEEYERGEGTCAVSYLELFDNVVTAE